MLKRMPFLLSVAALLAGAALAWSLASPQKGAALTPSCSLDTSITSPAPGSTLSGTQKLTVTVSTTVSTDLVDFYIDGGMAGTGYRSSTTTWSFDLNTAYYPDGTHNLYAKVIDTDSAGVYLSHCYTATVDVHFSNTTATYDATLEVTTSVPSWKGPTNSPVDILLTASVVSGSGKQDVTTLASYTWKTVTVGSITATNNIGYFNSGPTPGDGQIVVRVAYDTLWKEIVIPVSVLSSTTTTSPSTTTSGRTTTTTTSTTTTSTDTTTESAGDTTVSTTSTPLEGGQNEDALLQECLVKYLGEPAYRTIKDEGRRLSFSQFDASSRCFAGRNFTVPAKLAPLEPSKSFIRKLPENKQLAVKDIRTITGNGKKAIQLIGTALPGKRVFIYLFSEPLVLSSVADGEGRWTYTLEDPVQPGNHEAYVTVEGDNKRPQRSDAFGFAVATAPPSSSNPLGLSFDIQTSNQPALFMNAYLLGSVVLVAAALGAVLYIKYKNKAAAPGSSSRSTPPAAHV